MNIKAVAAVVAVFSLVGSAALAKAPAKAMIVTPAADLKWTPLMPGNDAGPQVAFVKGDPKKGPVAMFMKFPKGFNSGVHTHSSDYEASVIEGSPIHGAEGEEDAKAMGPGSFFAQPGKVAHFDKCDSDGGCMIFVRFDGKFDFQPVNKPAPKK